MDDKFEIMCRTLEEKGVAQNDRVIVSISVFHPSPKGVSVSMTFEELCDFTRTGRIW